MKNSDFNVVAFVVLLSFSTLCAASDSGSPVTKVVKLLEDLQEKIKHDGKSESAIYQKYSCWCTGMTGKKGKAIEKAKTDLKQLGKDIMSLRAKVAKCSSEVNDAGKDMKTNHEDQQKATEIRDKENAAFTATRAELGQGLQAMEQALTMLGESPKSSALLQRSQASSAQAAEAVRSAIKAIPDVTLGSMPSTQLAQLQRVADTVAKGSLNYDPSYGSIAGILKEMYSTFSKDLKKETDTENKANKDYEGLMNTKVKELLALQDKVDKKEDEKAEAAVDLADATQNYDDTETQMNADVEFFNEAVKSCEDKAKAWEVRSKMRDEELAGVEKAIEILTSDSARELFDKSINPAARVSFLQVEASPPAMSVGQQKAFQLLKMHATKSQNVILAHLAAQVRLAKGGHFTEVLAAVDKVIGVLKKEQEADNKKKTQCENEYQKVAKTSADLKWKIEKNDAKIEKLETDIANKEEEKASTIQAIKDVKKEMKDMTAERDAEKKSYEAAKKDDEASIKLLKEAKDALTAFYKKHGISFMQQGPKFNRGDLAPDAKFSDKGSRSGQTNGIVLLFENIIEGLEDEVRVQTKVENDAIAAFKKAMKAAEELEKDLDKKKTNLEKAIAARQKDKDDENKKKEANEKDLKSEEDYKAKIKPDCDFIMGAFMERYNKRQAEMSGLEQAKSYLSGAM